MNREIRLSIRRADALTADGDVLSLKYAQQYHGLDRAVTGKLAERGEDAASLKPQPGESRLLESRGAVAAQSILIVGVPRLEDFEYREIRMFGRQVLASLRNHGADARTVLATLHGANFGLDEIEAFEAEVAGFADAIQGGDFPPSLEEIVVVERDEGRAARLQAHLDDLIPGGLLSKQPSNEDKAAQESRTERLRSAGYASSAKAHAFVAMPFADAFSDVYHYGIQGAVRSSGYLCERADLSAYTGDVMGWVKRRISSASFVVADMTGANANVYLEVGYAWASGIPTILLTQDAADLEFNVKGQRCLVYSSIQDLEEKLSNELRDLDLPR